MRRATKQEEGPSTARRSPLRGSTASRSRVSRGVALAAAVAASLASAPASLARGRGERADPPRVERAQLANGLRLVLSREPAVPIVALTCLVDGGARLDPPDRPGLAGFVGALLDEGTKRRSAEQIAELVDGIGGTFATAASPDWIDVSAAVLARDWPTAVDLVASSLREPTFRKEDVERVRGEILGELRASEDQPGYVAERAFRKALFDGGPYGHPVTGTSDAVRRITRDEIASFHAREFRPDRTICVAVGDVSEAAMRSELERGLGSWRATDAPAAGRAAETHRSTAARAPARGNAGAAPRARRLIVDKPTEQANIVVGQTGVARDDPDFLALRVMNHILGGGGFTSRLMRSVRTREGLAYSVYSQFSSTRLPGPFEVVLQTKVSSAAEALRLVKREVRRMRDEGVTEEELRQAKDYIEGSFPLMLDSTAKLTSFLAQVEYFGLGDDYIRRYPERIEAVSAADVARVARAHLDPDALVEVLVGPQRELERQLGDAGAASSPGPSRPTLVPEGAVP